MRRKLAMSIATVAMTTGGVLVTTGAPAHAASWHDYRVYSNYYTCVSVGEGIVDRGGARDWHCKWDSPYYLLQLYY